MKSFLPSLLTLSALLLAEAAHAQDKPALNTAPPGSRPAPQPAPAPAPTTRPTPQPTPTPEPERAPTPAPDVIAAPDPAPANAPRPTSDNPSGLDFPGRTKSTTGFGGPALTAKKMFIYTNFGLGFSSFDGVSQLGVSVAPALGYRITERFAAGPGISYAYNRYGAPDGFVFPNGESSISTSSLGFKGFAQFMVYKQFFLHGEYEVTQAEALNQRLDKIKRTVTTPLLGAGYRNEFSSNAAADIVVLYNFNDGAYTGIYGQPVIRFNFLFNIGRATAVR